MNQRTLLDRLLSPAGFGLALLLFLIPFATVSCGVEGEHVDATFTGLDLVVGGQPSISGPNIDAEAEAQLAAVFQEDYAPLPLVIVAAVLLLVGMALALIPVRRIRALASAGTAVLAVIMLAIAIFVQAPGRADAAMDKFRVAAALEETIQTTTSPAFGFWLVTLLLLALAGWQGYEAVRTPLEEPDFDEPPGVPTPDAVAWPPPGAWPPQDPSSTPQ
jgi:amino acid transporter